MVKQTVLKEIQPLTFFTHCASRRHNLAISTVCTYYTQPGIRNAVGIISSLATYFCESVQRIYRLRQEMKANLPKEKQNKLK